MTLESGLFFMAWTTKGSTLSLEQTVHEVVSKHNLKFDVLKFLGTEHT